MSHPPDTVPPKVPTDLSPVLLRVSQGDRQAVNLCIDQYGSLVWSMARRMSLNSADAEDAVQEIFVDVWRHAKRYDPALGSEKVFIAVLARRRLVDRARKLQRRRQVEQPLEIEDEMATSPFAAEQDANIAEAQRVLRALPMPHQQAIKLALVEGLSHPEIAQLLGWPLGTVKSVIRRGILRLRGLVVGRSEPVSSERLP